MKGAKLLRGSSADGILLTLIKFVTIFLGLSVGATATAATFLEVKTLMIMAMGVVAFGFGTLGLARIEAKFLEGNDRSLRNLVGTGLPDAAYPRPTCGYT